MIEKIKSNRAGYVIGVFFLVSSPLPLGLNYRSLINNGSYNPYSLYLGIVFFVMGIVFLLFPGSEHKVIDYPGQQVRLKLFWEYAPQLHKIAWGLGFVISILACINVEANLPYLVLP